MSERQNPSAYRAAPAEWVQGGSTVDQSAGLKVLRQTYQLLSMTLLFSAVIAFVSMSIGIGRINVFVVLGGYFGLLFLTNYLRNSPWGLVSVFALTGFMGFTLGPLLNLYLERLPNGSQVIATALMTTGVAFIGLSIYARSAKAPDMMKFGSFLTIGILTAFVLGLVAYFFQMPALSLAVSGLFVLLMCGLIMWETQSIVNGGETNYIMATVTLYVSIYNLFTSLLHLLGFMGSDD